MLGTDYELVVQEHMSLHLFLQGKYQEAIPYYEKALAINPGAIFCRAYLGFIINPYLTP